MAVTPESVAHTVVKAESVAHPVVKAEKQVPELRQKKAAEETEGEAEREAEEVPGVEDGFDQRE